MSKMTMAEVRARKAQAFADAASADERDPLYANDPVGSLAAARHRSALQHLNGAAAQPTQAKSRTTSSPIRRRCCLSDFRVAEAYGTTSSFEEACQMNARFERAASK